MRLTLAITLAWLAAPAFAEADLARGEALFRPCAACHMIGEGAVHRIGPHLNALDGRYVGGAEGFGYSRPMAGAGENGQTWDVYTLDAFLEAPRDFLPGTSMVFRGIRDADDRANLVAYIIDAGGGAQVSTEAAAPDPEVAAILDYPPDEAYGAYLSSECTACHGSGEAGIPAIEGLPPEIFAAGLVAYRNGTREHQVMSMLAARLGDEEIAALAAYFATAD